MRSRFLPVLLLLSWASAAQAASRRDHTEDALRHAVVYLDAAHVRLASGRVPAFVRDHSRLADAARRSSVRLRTPPSPVEYPPDGADFAECRRHPKRVAWTDINDSSWAVFLCARAYKPLESRADTVSRVILRDTLAVVMIHELLHQAWKTDDECLVQRASNELALLGGGTEIVAPDRECSFLVPHLHRLAQEENVERRRPQPPRISPPAARMPSRPAEAPGNA